MTYSSKGSKIIETVDKSRWKKVIVIYIYIYIYIYIIIGKIEKKNPIRFQIGIKLESDFMPCVPSKSKFLNFCVK